MTQQTNQREIRFRAWIPSYNEMRYMPEPSEDYKGYISLRIARFFSTLDAEDTGHYIMQYIGLKDKNGKGIYEGDIMSQTFDRRPTSVIIYNIFGGFHFKWVDDRFIKIRGKNPQPIFRNISLFEIIGNIYENPELLK